MVILRDAEVWTGTLLNTTDGDLSQAHASVLVEGMSGELSMTMALHSRMASSQIVLSAEN